MQESDQDYPPDDESFGDNDSSDVTAKHKKLKSGTFESSRNPDNEFVFDKEWAFKRMCTLESLLSAKLLSSTSKNFVFARNSCSHQHGEECSKENRALDADKSFKSFCVDKSRTKKQNELFMECKPNTNDSTKSRETSNKTVIVPKI